MVPHLFVIQKIKRETYDTYTFELVPRERDTRMVFSPGQFNMLYMGVVYVPDQYLPVESYLQGWFE